MYFEPHTAQLWVRNILSDCTDCFAISRICDGTIGSTMGGVFFFITGWF
jgi:hypothetical protein